MNLRISINDFFINYDWLKKSYNFLKSSYLGRISVSFFIAVASK